MKKQLLITAIVIALSSTAWAQDLTWRKDIKPVISAKCAVCHSAAAPDYWEWMQMEKRDKVGPRMDGYGSFMNYVVWPATGAMMRRLDDGKAGGGKAGNMYLYLGATDAERAQNLKAIKEWLGGDDAWFTNRWEARGKTPAVTKGQLEKIKAKY